MSWLKIDDNFPDSAKVDGLSDAAARLWVMAACWCRKPEHLHLKGFIPEAALPTICKRRWSTEQVRELVRELVDATVGGLHKFGLWEPVEGGWKFHDWGQYQPDDRLTASELARLGGLASAEARRTREGTAVPKGARNRTVTEQVHRTDTEQVRNQFGQQVHRTDTELTEPPDPDPDPRSDLAKAAASAQDLTASARVEPPKPRQQREREVESEPNPEPAPLPRHAANGPQVAPPGRAKLITPSERQPEALPTRRQRHTLDLEALPIGELAKRWKANPTWVEESSPQARPELVEATRAWEVAVGLAHRQLGRPSRDSCAKALLELYADGVPHADIMRACAQVAKDGWICGREPGRNGDAPRKRRIDCLSHAVLRRLLDAADAARPSSVNPRVAAILDEFTPEKTA